MELSLSVEVWGICVQADLKGVIKLLGFFFLLTLLSVSSKAQSSALYF